jgi:hypothetical protein
LLLLSGLSFKRWQATGLSNAWALWAKCRLLAMFYPLESSLQSLAC